MEIGRLTRPVLGFLFAGCILLPGAVRAQSVLLIQDNDPWGYEYWFDLLPPGQPGTVLGSESIATVTLLDYDLVIVPSQQPSTFNTTFNANVGRFEDYLDQGGRLILMLATYTSYTPIIDLPYGAWQEHDDSTLTGFLTVLDPHHPIMASMPEATVEMDAHGYLYDYGKADELTANEYSAVTSYFLGVGAGALFVSSSTLEYANHPEGLLIGSNVLDYMLGGYCPDLDGDGYLGCVDDCDDGDPAVGPDVAEIPCNGIDDDCNDFTPDSVDEDGDGYLACDDDCNDGDASVHPGAEEVCDGQDNDCDPGTDEIADGLCDESDDDDSDGDEEPHGNGCGCRVSGGDGSRTGRLTVPTAFGLLAAGIARRLRR